MTERWLLFGASGAVGSALLRLFAETDPDVRITAVSRRPHTDRSIDWQLASIERFAFGPEPFDVVACAGPLDAFATLLARERPRAHRIVALSSTSAHTKVESRDAAERALARRLIAAEAELAHACARYGIACTILRPTLIYGTALDRNLTRIAAFARRWRVVPLPRDARGLRQPVHAGDVARAMRDAARSDAAANRRYDLPGGETLDYTAMVERVCATAPARARIVRVGTTRGIARALRLVGSPLATVVERMATDLAFDASDAARDFGYSPRGFDPRS